MEDVYLATNVINHNINVFRADEPELVHLFHQKHCDPKLSPQQLDGCVKGRVFNLDFTEIKLKVVE